MDEIIVNLNPASMVMINSIKKFLHNKSDVFILYCQAVHYEVAVLLALHVCACLLPANHVIIDLSTISY